MRVIMRASLPVALMLVVLHLSLTAQNGKAVLMGTAKDSTGAVLPGARIRLESNGPSSVSDAQGQFYISNVNTGEYKMTVTYLGFDSFEKSITVASGQTLQVDAILNVQKQNEVVTVSGDRTRGEAYRAQ